LIVGGRFSSRWILGLGLALILGVVLYWNALANELALTVADLQGQLVHRSSTSVGIRLSLWSASLEAIQSSPFIGHGIQNKMSVVVGLMDENLRWIKYSHVHNAYLDAMVAGGIGAGIALIALLISPLAMVFGYAHEQSDRRFVVVALVILFMVRGLTGNLLTQDLLVVTLLFSFIMPAMCDPENRDLTLRRGNGAHLP
jgi:O-antigen ligase